MAYQTRSQVTIQSVQTLITQLGWQLVQVPNVPLAIANDDGDIIEHYDIHEAYRTLLHEIALRRVAP